MATVTLVDPTAHLDLTWTPNSEISLETSKAPDSSAISSILPFPVSPYAYNMYTDRDFNFKVTVGYGGSARVVVGQFVLKEEEHCVVKIARHYLGGEAQTAKEIEHERAALSYLNAVAPGAAVRCFGTYHVLQTALDNETGPPRFSLPQGIVLEYFPHADFFGVLDHLRNNQGQSLNPAIARWYVMDILYRLSTIHWAGFYHGDIKAENLLMTAEGRIVFGDFGEANMDDESKWDLVGFGTHGCQAPEICYSEAPAISGPRRPSDIWSVGVLLYRMLFASNPFEPVADDDDVAYGVICDFFDEESWPTIADSDPYRFERIEALHFLQKLLVFEPENRIKCDEVASHAWLYRHWDDVVYSRREAPLVFRDGQWCVGRTWEGVIFSQVIG